MELAPVPDYKSNCTFQTDKHSLSFNYAHVVFNKHFHLAAVRGNGAKGAAGLAAAAGGQGWEVGQGVVRCGCPKGRAGNPTDWA